MTAAGPVSGVITPTLMVVPSKPGPGDTAAPPPLSALFESLLLLRHEPAAMANTATAASNRSTGRFLMVHLAWMGPMGSFTSCSPSAVHSSVREGPEPEVALQTRPQRRQPEGLDEQEHDDQHPEHQVVERRHADDPRAARPVDQQRQARGVPLDHLRQPT